MTGRKGRPIGSDRRGCVGACHLNDVGRHGVVGPTRQHDESGGCPPTSSGRVSTELPLAAAGGMTE